MTETLLRILANKEEVENNNIFLSIISNDVINIMLI